MSDKDKRPHRLTSPLFGARSGMTPAGARLGPYGNPSDDLLRPVIPADKKIIDQIQQQQLEIIAQPPRHIEAPLGAETLDIRRALVLTPATIDQELVSFTCPEGANVFITDYAVYTDAASASLIDFRPVRNGQRVLAYHGDPNDNYRINLSIADNLADYALIKCQIVLTPGQTITWLATNLDIVNYTFAVRMKGYFDFSRSSTAKMGG